MSKVTGPLFSLGAIGTFAKLLSFRNGRAGTEVVHPQAPQAPASPAQLAARNVARNALAHWRELPPAERQDWSITAASWRLPPFALFLREYTLQRCEGEILPLIPADRAPTD